MQGTSHTEWHALVICNNGITIQGNSSSFSLYLESNYNVNIYSQRNIVSRKKHYYLRLIWVTVDSEIQYNDRDLTQRNFKNTVLKATNSLMLSMSNTDVENSKVISIKVKLSMHVLLKRWQ
jgi:hypothetical protein